MSDFFTLYGRQLICFFEGVYGRAHSLGIGRNQIQPGSNGLSLSPAHYSTHSYFSSDQTLDNRPRPL
jgi:hypothetical protein